MVRLKSQSCGLPECYSVLEEALESWHYVVTDEVVYIEQFAIRNNDPFVCVTEVDANLHRWIQLNVWLGAQGEAHYTAVICPRGERRNLGGMAHLDVDSNGLQGDSTVFVDVPKPVKSPQFSGCVGVPLHGMAEAS